MTFKQILLATAFAAPVALAAQAASAQTIVALAGDNTLVTIDAAAKKATKTVQLTGATGKVLGLDVRPADGQLYGLLADGTVVTIDKDGKATTKVKLEKTLPDGVTATVDFNPAADRLRVMGSDGTSLRANVDDGKVTVDGSHKFAEGDMHKGEKPNVVAGAYTNSVKGTKETTLYNIDGTIGALVKQAPPNDGVLGAVGKLGIMPKAVAFDIQSDAQGGNKAWLLADGELYAVDIATGKATSAGKIAGLPANVRDIAIVPAAM